MRARNIKPNFFVDGKTGKLSSNEKVLFIGLWCLADREGFFNNDPDEIKVQIFPYDSKIHIDKMLCNLMSLHLITCHDAIGMVNNFAKHQRPHPHEAKSEVSDDTRISFKTNVIKCHDMSCNVMQCTSDIRNDDIRNDDIRNEERGMRNEECVASPDGLTDDDRLVVDKNILTPLKVKIEKHLPNFKKLDKSKGFKIIGLMLRQDDRTIEEIATLIEWYPIGEEYIPEIYSFKALREKYDKLYSASKREKHQKDNHTEKISEMENNKLKREADEAFKKLVGDYQ